MLVEKQMSKIQFKKPGVINFEAWHYSQTDITFFWNIIYYAFCHFVTYNSSSFFNEFLRFIFSLLCV